MRRGLWFWWSTAGALATVGYYLLPRGSLAASTLYSGIGLCAALMIIVGVRRQRPRRPGLWYLFAAGQLGSVAGDLVWQYYVFVLHEEPYPSIADAFYLAAYLPLVLGLLQFVRGRGRGDLGGLIDATMIASGIGLVLWIFVLHPTAAAEAASVLEQVISIAYPVADVLLLAMLTRLFVSGGARTTSTRLLGAAALLLFMADVAFSVVTLHSDGDGQELSAGWLMSYVLWAAAALHPSMAMRHPTATASAPRFRRARRSRRATRAARAGRGPLSLATLCSLLAPAMLFMPNVGANTVDRIAIAAVATVLGLLGFVRTSGLMRTVRGQTDRLQHLATHDDLTGLANRRHFESMLRQAAEDGEPAVVHLGLTGFKSVNDELGRPVGDRALLILAARIRDAVPSSTLIARVGGDEFALLLPGPASGAAEHLARRLADAMREPVHAGGHELLVGAGIGVAASGTAVGPEELLRRAEAAMYAAKATGEPYQSWSPTIDESAGEQARLGAEIRTALDSGQFRVVYQPIVAVPEGRVAAAEALVRWDHPERGPVSPAYFIPVAERNGLIVELGAWVLRTACEQMARWRRDLGARAPDRISVNVSARQLARPGFPHTVAEALASAGLPPECLAVEVTETAVFEGGRAVAALHELRALGVRIALDDFGTGHSSLRLLQTVPVDILKVDKSFVDDITGAGEHRVIAEALIHVSAGLGLTAVAEGVETAEQAEVLYRLGYRLLQGYHFGRPVPADEFRVAGPAVIHA
ncbi:bifunctional diguanylate cyclase/phosphodiesterase [Actinoplanes sp. NEAU-A12]|uniref:Bifunctional diguanylate cyclase/phosphodiesterase n=1 Tax=Actinoplanes sandaracinus TaxID=3045177 RepID=A0ABT6WIF8_9ACTN|nr:bifunctional diguanylate cyclase/phosphodiesterase [Actinoplanes sandaracinus]MDI6099518.1 bifunctional diguanylate cyclase/phosphodiesterase [Actinoplanes sandaracinus]